LPIEALHQHTAFLYEKPPMDRMSFIPLNFLPPLSRTMTNWQAGVLSEIFSVQYAEL
jgi:hypothetical protein